ncbi:hypothetical protein L208DRAFT_1401573 [Tricholoma matsutake]|nr:hypothetical protein L208DRAFT_1401573 [Tricholoma matsutake 945]
MHVIGTANPHFVAKIDDAISFVCVTFLLRNDVALSGLRSAVKPQTQSPVWNEQWKIKNVPTTGELEVLDKDGLRTIILLENSRRLLSLTECFTTIY